MLRERSFHACAALGLLLIEIGLARYVHDRFFRPYVGDSLAVIFAYCTFRAGFGWRRVPAVAAAFALAVAIEYGQYWGLIYRLGLAGNPIARFALGSGYDPRDFIAYAAGALCVLGWPEKPSPGRERVG
jgi:hypothetical protein